MQRDFWPLLLLAGVAGPAYAHGVYYVDFVVPSIWIGAIVGFIGGRLGVGRRVSRFKGLGTSLLALVVIAFMAALLIGDVGFLTFIFGALPLAASYLAVELTTRFIDRKRRTRNTNEDAR